MRSPHSADHSKLDGLLVEDLEVRRYYCGVCPVMGESGIKHGCYEYSNLKRDLTWCLLQNSVAWLLDPDAWVEQCLGVLPPGKNIQKLAAVLHSYGSVYRRV